jgi:hypothetical protein
MAQTDQKNKSKHQLDLLEEKRAYVVIALTDRLSHAGMLVALNALAHYNSERGYSWASIPVVAKESGYSPHSTKSISPGFSEIEKVGAFRVVRTPASKGGKKSSTYRCCPIMPWFRDEYERLLRAGKIEDDSDPFADLRSNNDNLRQGESPGVSDESPGYTGQIARSDRANNPVTQGKSPEEENRLKGTDLTEQKEQEKDAGGADGSQDGSSSIEPWPADGFEKFWEYNPNKINRKVALDEFNKIERAGKIEWRDIMAGLREYKTNKPEHVAWLSPVTFLRDERWKDKPAKLQPKPSRKQQGYAI